MVKRWTAAQERVAGGLERSCVMGQVRVGLGNGNGYDV